MGAAGGVTSKTLLTLSLLWRLQASFTHSVTGHVSCLVREHSSGAPTYVYGCTETLLRCPRSKPESIKSFKNYFLKVMIFFDSSIFVRSAWVELLIHTLCLHIKFKSRKIFHQATPLFTIHCFLKMIWLPSHFFQHIANAESMDNAILAFLVSFGRIGSRVLGEKFVFFFLFFFWAKTFCRHHLSLTNRLSPKETDFILRFSKLNQRTGVIEVTEGGREERRKWHSLHPIATHPRDLFWVVPGSSLCAKPSLTPFGECS